MSDWALIISKATTGDPEALRQLLDAAYTEVRAAARFLMRGQARGTLQTTALVHEAFRRVLDRDAPPYWESPEHFFNSMITIMRNVIREHIRAKHRDRRSPRGVQVPLTEDVATEDPNDRLDWRLALDEALGELSALDSTQARIAELRYYCGLTISETSTVTGLSEGQVSRVWAHAQAWLRVRLDGQVGPRGNSDGCN